MNSNIRHPCPQLRKKPRRPLRLSIDDPTDPWPDGLFGYCRSRRCPRSNTPSTAELSQPPAADPLDSPSTDSESGPDSDSGHKQVPHPNPPATAELLRPAAHPPDPPSKPFGLEL
ncbi:hypothetical protein B0H12DRAFT_716889 [Mycena haematopus]|nr:hypothetical protein B0H12DRAFT_716889 [Mycena haematopus]